MIIKKRTIQTLASMMLCCLITTAYAKRIPNLEAKNLSGAPEKVEALRGSIAVINFWATWCGPCKEEMPRLAKLKDEYSAKGVRFVAISVDEPKSRAKIEPFLKLQNIDMEVWVGGNLDMLTRAGLGNVLPATIIIDQQGEIIGRIMGEAKDEDIKSRLDWLLNGRQGPAPEPSLKRY
ncbi:MULTISPECIES: TlpA disulfide reductase family protein [Acidobacteriaceae]|uniref:TlpA family protein disulfide reductase n=1 Tax=Acidobacteriaceae TaxID=204434 RepID=UPI0020B125A0|nr:MULTISPECIES: TlpA disulfide reductase family protein [Acidobacteriaceae]MDW5264562.1 TlpA disulfide reductase family protein [Edaphobacter sp.]